MSVSCLECGAENREEAKFCRSCGFALARGSAAAAAPADELPPSALADTVPAALDEARPGPRTIDFDPTEAPPAPAPVPAPVAAAPLAAPAPRAAGLGTSPAARLAQPEADEDLPEPAWASREPLPVGSGSAGRWALVIAALVCVGAAALWFGRTTRLPAVAAGSAPASASLAPVPASPGAEASPVAAGARGASSTAAAPVAVPVAASRAAGASAGVAEAPSPAGTARGVGAADRAATPDAAPPRQAEARGPAEPKPAAQADPKPATKAAVKAPSKPAPAAEARPRGEARGEPSRSTAARDEGAGTA